MTLHMVDDMVTLVLNVGEGLYRRVKLHGLENLEGTDYRTLGKQANAREFIRRVLLGKVLRIEEKNHLGALKMTECSVYYRGVDGEEKCLNSELVEQGYTKWQPQ